MRRRNTEPYNLSRESIAWAIRHIDRFGDTDILPVPVDYKAIFADVENVSSDLSEIEMSEYCAQVPRRVAVPKAIGGFRIASQLDPADAILFTALAQMLAPKIEDARISRSARSSCSFRIDIQSDGQFFKPGFGFDDFNRATEHHIRNRETRYILSVDLADYYNQISHHRISNNLESAGLAAADCSTIEKLLTSFSSNHHSRGLPIGPTASIVFAEAAMIDIDAFIRDKGVPFCRYVDDFRLFFPDQESALCFLAELTEMLFSSHRLATNTTKTRLWSKDTFGDEIVDEHALEEESRQSHLMDIIRARSESCAPADDDTASAEEINRATRKAIDELFQKVENSEPVQTGLAKFVLILHR